MPETPILAAPAQPSSAGAAQVPAPAPVPRWHILRRLYDWMMGFAHSRYATLALCIFSFIEAIFFPIPPIVLQVPMTLERRGKAWYYALVCTVPSVLGGLVGYAVGMMFTPLVTRLFGQTAIDTMHGWAGNVWLLTGGAIAVHPFKLYTLASGVLRVPFGSFVLASIVGRSVLFFSIATLLWFFGPPVRRFIDRYFNILTVAVGVLIVGAVVAWRVYVSHPAAPAGVP